MGCCGSAVGAECKARLDKVERDLTSFAHTTKDATDATENLDLLATCAKEVREVMMVYVQGGAKDQFGMKRVEKLSDQCLDDLRKRIKGTLLKQEDSQAILDRILAVGKDLDAVRATKATVELQRMVDRGKGAMEEAEEKQAASTVSQVTKALAEITDLRKLIPGVKKVLELAEKVHATKPDSERITDLLLRNLVEVSNRVLKMQKDWAVDIEAAKLVKDLASQVDALAEKLVVIMKTTWDPSLAGQVDYVTGSKAQEVCTRALKAADKALKDDNGGAAYDNLEILVPWWPYIPESGTSAATLSFIGIFSKMQTFATDAFKKAGDAGDTATADSIKGFAAKFDQLRAKFEGLPPAEHAGLGEQLEAAQIAGAINKHIKTFHSELAKTKDDDASTQLSLAATIQALEQLVGLWPSRPETETDCIMSLASACNDLEKWAEEKAQTSAANKVDGLLKLAEEYDARREKLVPPEIKNGSLYGRIQSHAVKGHLKGIEAELKKPEGINPNVLLDGFRAIGLAFPKDGARDELKARLVSALDLSEQTITKKYTGCLSAGESRKALMMQQFAGRFDSVRADCVTAGGRDEAFEFDDGPNLTSKLQDVLKKTFDKEFETIDVELAKSTGLNLSQVHRALKSLETLWPRESKGAVWSTGIAESEYRAKLTKVLESLEERLAGVCEKLCSSDISKASKFLEIAGDLEGTVASLETTPEGSTARSFRSKLVVQVVKAHVSTMQKALTDPKAMDLDALTISLEATRKIFQAAEFPEEAAQALGTVLSVLEDAVMTRLLQLEPDARRSRQEAAEASNAEGCLALAEAADSASQAANGSLHADGGLQKKVRDCRLTTEKMTEALTELGKESGTNPKVVLQAIQELQTSWSNVGHRPVFCSCLESILAKFREKMIEAGQKAIAGGEESKVTALLGFAQEVDNAELVLVQMSTGLAAPSVKKALQLVIAESFLTKMEAELSKETGMNPTAVLKGSQDVANLGPGLRAKSADGDEMTRLKSEKADKVTLDILISRISGAQTLIGRRMQESMSEAVTSKNVKKQEALLKFADDFDTAWAQMHDPDKGFITGSAPNVKEGLEAVRQGAAVESNEAAPTNAVAPPAGSAGAEPPSSTVFAAPPSSTVFAAPPSSSVLTRIEPASNVVEEDSAPAATAKNAAPPAATAPARRAAGDVASTPPTGSV